MHRARLFCHHYGLETVFVYGTMVVHNVRSIAPRILRNQQGRKKPRSAHSVVCYVLFLMVGTNVIGGHDYPNAIGPEDIRNYRGAGNFMDLKPRYQ